jgi:hypothetical protein
MNTVTPGLLASGAKALAGDGTITPLQGRFPEGRSMLKAPPAKETSPLPVRETTRLRTERAIGKLAPGQGWYRRSQPFWCTEG